MRARKVVYTGTQSRARNERGFTVPNEDTKTKAKKSLGQNFLKSVGALQSIIKAGNITPNDTILEIGPGRGALTRKLLDTGATVVAIEKDRELIPILGELFATEIKKKKLILIEGDILSSMPKPSSQANFTEACPAPPLSKLLVSSGFGNTNYSYKVIANIPYYITGEIIRLFLETEHQPEIIVFMVQKEVAERIVCRDGKESVLSLSVKAYGTPKYIATVPRGAFTPSPKVDSAIVQIVLDKKQFMNKKQEEAFFKIVKIAFSAKRKKAFSNILPITEKTRLEKIFTQLGLDQNIRPERITLDQWIYLSKEL